MVKNRKNLKLILVGAGILATAAIIYFFIVPLIQSNVYRSTVSDKQPEVQTQFEKFVGLLDRDIFTKSDLELATIRTDIKASEDVTANTKEALSLYGEHIDEFTELPLMAWNPTYNNTLELHEAENTYVTEGNAAVKEMEAILAYFNSSADQVAELDEVEKDFENIGNLGSIEEIQQVLDQGITKLDMVVKQMGQLNAPESLSDQHESGLAMSEKLLAKLQQFSKALKDGDLEKLESTSNDIQKITTQYEKEADVITKAFINESKLRKHFDAAQQADNEKKKLLEA